MTMTRLTGIACTSAIDVSQTAAGTEEKTKNYADRKQEETQKQDADVPEVSDSDSDDEAAAPANLTVAGMRKKQNMAFTALFGAPSHKPICMVC